MWKILRRVVRNSFVTPGSILLMLNVSPMEQSGELFHILYFCDLVAQHGTKIAQAETV